MNRIENRARKFFETVGGGGVVFKKSKFDGIGPLNAHGHMGLDFGLTFFSATSHFFFHFFLHSNPQISREQKKFKK